MENKIFNLNELLDKKLYEQEQKIDNVFKFLLTKYNNYKYITLTSIDGNQAIKINLSKIPEGDQIYNIFKKLQQNITMLNDELKEVKDFKLNVEEKEVKIGDLGYIIKIDLNEDFVFLKFQVKVETERDTARYVKLITAFKNIFTNYFIFVVAKDILDQLYDEIKIIPGIILPEDPEDINMAKNTEMEEIPNIDNIIKNKINSILNPSLADKYVDDIINGNRGNVPLERLIKNLLENILIKLEQPLNEEYLKFYDVLSFNKIKKFDDLKYLNETIIVEELMKLYKTVKYHLEFEKILSEEVMDDELKKRYTELSNLVRSKNLKSKELIEIILNEKNFNHIKESIKNVINEYNTYFSKSMDEQQKKGEFDPLVFAITLSNEIEKYENNLKQPIKI